jgi:hypothetical protein
MQSRIIVKRNTGSAKFVNFDDDAGGSIFKSTLNLEQCLEFLFFIHRRIPPTCVQRTEIVYRSKFSTVVCNDAILKRRDSAIRYCCAARGIYFSSWDRHAIQAQFSSDRDLKNAKESSGWVSLNDGGRVQWFLSFFAEEELAA